MTFPDLVTDFWAHAHANNPKLRDEEIDDDFASTLRELGLTEEDLAEAPAPPSDDDEVLADVTYGGPGQ